jgi:hypothetical protein
MLQLARSADVAPMVVGGTAPAIGARPGRTPTVLLAATCGWGIAGQLAIAFHEQGCRVVGLSPPRHPLRAVACVARQASYRALAPLSALRRAISRHRPDLIIPCDDRARDHLDRVHRTDAALRPVIERSLGRPAGYGAALSRTGLMEVAAASGLRVPAHRGLRDAAELAAWCAAQAPPWVLKADHSWGGQGVRLVAGAPAAEAVFRLMDRPPSLRQMLGGLLGRHDPFAFRDWLDRRPAVLSVQRHIRGRPANCAIACWDGEMLGGIAVEVEETLHPTGPSAVIRRSRNPAMLEAAGAIVAALGMSGLVGFDFIIEAGTGVAWLIEMNPRATPICHLALGPGADLVAPLAARLTGRPPATRPAVTEAETIALFPNVVGADPASPALRRGYHDVPWEEPELVRALLASRERGMVGALGALLRPFSRLGGPALPNPEREWRQRGGALF